MDPILTQYIENNMQAYNKIKISHLSILKRLIRPSVCAYLGGI